MNNRDFNIDQNNRDVDVSIISPPCRIPRYLLLQQLLEGLLGLVLGGPLVGLLLELGSLLLGRLSAVESNPEVDCKRRVQLT